MHKSTQHTTRAATIVTAVGVAAAMSLTACSGGSNGADGDGARPTVTVQVVKDARALPMAEMPWTKDLEEACDATIVWQETTGSSWDQQRAASLAAGEVADVTIGGFGMGDMAQYRSLFLDLGPELENMPTLSKVFEEIPYAKVVSAYIDGGIYGAPGIRVGLTARDASHMFINKQWLDNLGLDVPTTREELHTALKAFKDGDPTGTGAEVIPFDFNAPSTDGWGWFQPNQFLGGRGIVISNGGPGDYVQGGEMKNYLTSPAYKELVQFMHELWADGLISPEAFTHDWSQYTAATKNEGDVAKVGLTIMWTPSDIFGPNLAPQYVTIPQLLVEDGQSEAPVWGVNQDPVKTMRAMVSANVKNKEAALCIVDAMYTPDISVQMTYGSFGVAVEKSGEGEYTILTPPEDEHKNASDWQFMHSLSDGAPGWPTQPGITLHLPAEHVEFIDVDRTYDVDYANVDFNTDVIYSGWTFTEDEVEQRKLTETGIVQNAMNKFAQWVTQGGVESEWDAYVADLEKNGIATNTASSQAAYDRFMELMKAENVDLETDFGGAQEGWTVHEDGSATYTR